MLIRFFKRSFYVQYLSLLLISGLLWIRAIIEPCTLEIVDDSSPLFQLLYGILPASQSIPGLAILILEALLLNFILVRHEIVPKNNMIAALVFIVFMSQSPIALTLNPVLLACLFAILAFDRLLNTYGKADPTKDVFSTAILLALASLFYFPLIYLQLLLFISFIIFGTFSLRIFLVGIAGSFTVYLYLFLYYFLTDNLEGQLIFYTSWFRRLPELILDFSISQYIVWAMQFILFIAGFLYVISHMHEWNISVRKKMLISEWWLIVAGLTAVYGLSNPGITLLVFVVPASVIISAYLSNRRKPGLINELLVLLLILFTIFHNIRIGVC